MKDYVRGAYQALAWVRELLKVKDLEKVMNEIENALEDINHNVATDFRWRIKD